MSKYAIIVAGGKGMRMGSEIPKQFLEVNGLPILMHTLRRFRAYSNDLQLILVLPHEQQDFWRKLCTKHQFEVEHLVVDGGESRFDSSLNGLRAIPNHAEGLVAIHDGVRPFVSVEVIAACFDEAARSGAAIPVLPVTDTIRYVGKQERGHNVQRTDYRVVQTPQVFSIALLSKAFQNATEGQEFTDDASVVEAFGASVEMVPGNKENIKVTTPMDLLVAEALLKNNDSIASEHANQG